MLLLGEQDFAASGHDNLDANSLVMVTLRQATRYSPDSRALQLLLPEAPDQIADPEHWLFLDTETTGLAGGSGTYAFLVGVGWWEGGGLEIEQFFMREYSEERALLFAVLAHEELFNLKPATFPPANTDEERIRAASARKSCSLCVHKKPVLGISDLVRCLWQKQLEGA